MSLKKHALILAFATALAGYWLYEPLFPDMENVGMLRIIVALNKVTNLIGCATEKLGYMSRVNITRGSVKMILQHVPDPDSVEIYDDEFNGVPVRIFRPVLADKSPQDELPGLVFIHGGGWVQLDVDVYHSLTAKMAQETGYVVVSVDYRRAPEYVFPIPFDDCVTATIYFLRHASDYAVDVNRIAVIGDSAGGNLAAAVTLRMTEETDLPPVKAEVLVYPALQAFDFRSPSMLTRDLPGFLTQKVMIHYWLLYYQGHSDNWEKFITNNHTSTSLKKSEYGEYVDYSLLPEDFLKDFNEKPDTSIGDEKLSKSFEPTLLNPYFNPLLAKKLDKLPPTLMITTEYDVLRDDGFRYVRRLAEQGVKVKHRHFENSFHGFINLDNTAGQKEFLVTVSEYLHETM